ncbi:SubName: Full=Uncharacterized protein {ECO:0000313/EMBL:CCA75685.1} [Serendipita indica DSM 11827]|nr:SubName: Full=Uncharacterized protein {ECO:0000313/EMBL:CCA75685.1} [Serendipita indica DSM 11827]
MLSTLFKRANELLENITTHPVFEAAQAFMHLADRADAIKRVAQHATNTLSDVAGGVPDLYRERENSKSCRSVSRGGTVVEDYESDSVHDDDLDEALCDSPNDSALTDPTEPELPNLAKRRTLGLKETRFTYRRSLASPYGIQNRHPVWGWLTGVLLFSVMFIAAIQLNPHWVLHAGAGNATEAEPESPWAALARIQDQFAPILRSSGTGITALRDMDQVTKAVRDLKALVGESDLESRDRVIPVLQAIAQSATKTGADLFELDSKVVRASDTMSMINNHAIQSLKAISLSQKSLSGAIYHYFHPKDAREQLREELDAACDQMLGGVDSLVNHAHGIWGLLKIQEDNFASIRKEFNSDIKSNDANVGLLLAQLWTRVGGNKNRLKYYEGHNELLKEVTVHVETATERVSWTIDQLLQIISAIKDLRERLTVWVHTEKFALPIERHLEVVMSGALRLSGLQENVRQNREGAADWVANGHKYPTI